MQLILNTYGASLSKKDKMFLVRHPDGEQKVAPEGLRSIVLHKGARISSDAVVLAIDHQIEVQFVDRSGQPRGRVWSHRYGSVSTIRRRQVYFGQSAQALTCIQDLLAQKLRNQMYNVAAHKVAGTRYLDRDTLQAMGQQLNSVLRIEAPTLAEAAPRLRGLEGAASRAYFAWMGQVVGQEYAFEGRSRRPARDMCNSLLNYLYGMLYARVEGALVLAGLDPYLGLMHSDEHNRPVLVYDVIEPFRPWADAVLLHLCREKALATDLFEVNNGGYWLGTAGRALAIESFNAYLAQVTDYKGTRRSRAIHIELCAQALAQTILNHSHEP